MAKRLVMSLILAGLLGMTALTAAAQPQNETEVDVTSQDLDGTSINTYGFGGEDTTTMTFVEGPDTPPLGSGSLEFDVGANGSGGGEIRFTDYGGTSLSNITDLSFWTHVQAPDADVSPYMALYVDGDGNGEFTLGPEAEDYILFYDPWEQTGQDVTLNTWQEWDTLAEGNLWRQFKDPSVPQPREPFSYYVNQNPDATIFGQGIRVFAGFGGFENFVGNTDAVSVGVNGETTVYDLEPVVTACVDENTGYLRLVEDAEQCDSGESAEHWMVGDPQGEQIYACVSGDTDYGRIVDDPDECRDFEEVVQWARGTGEGPQITACADDSNSRYRRSEIARIVDDPAECNADEQVVQWDDAFADDAVADEDDGDTDGPRSRR